MQLFIVQKMFLTEDYNNNDTALLKLISAVEFSDAGIFKKDRGGGPTYRSTRKSVCVCGGGGKIKRKTYFPPASLLAFFRTTLTYHIFHCSSSVRGDIPKLNYHPQGERLYQKGLLAPQHPIFCVTSKSSRWKVCCLFSAYQN